LSSGEPRESPSPSAYREQNPYKPPPPEYKPPSVLAEHKGLATLFAAILLAFGVYAWKILHAPARQRDARIKEPISQEAASAAQPIYIEAVPDKQTR
jgi:hypothetical protein